MGRIITYTSLPLTLIVILGVSGCCTTPKCKCPVSPRLSVAPPLPPDSAPRRGGVVQTRSWPAPCDVGLRLVAKQAAAHLHLSELVGWYGHTRGEASMKRQLFVGRERLISRRTLAYIRECLPAVKDPQQRLAAEYLRDYLAMAYIERMTAAQDDALSAAEIGATVKLSWMKTATRYRDLPGLLSGAKQPARRAEIAAAMSRIRRTVLNPLLVRKLVRTHELAQWMGYKSYAQLGTLVRRVKLRALIRQGDGFVKTTDGLFKRLMKQVARESLKVDLGKLRRADHARLFRTSSLERSLPRKLMLPAFKYFLQGIGLGMRTAAGTTIKVDDSLFPGKKFRAACYPLEVPKDIRITVKPAGGVTSWVTLFHEGGHALHFAWTTTRQWEFQQLGSYSLTEAFAELFARAWEEPAWLKRYAKFTQEVNGRKHRGTLLARGLKIRRVPKLTTRQMAALIRSRLAYNMYLARRYGWAKLIYEAVLHGGNQRLWQSVYTGQTSDRRALYRSLFQQAYGYALTDTDADRYLTDVDPFFYAADYARAFMLADLLHEHLRAKFGPNWFENPKVGAYLKGLWASGNRYTAEQIAQKLGTTLSYQASVTRLHRLYAAAERMSGRKAPRPHPRRRSAVPCRPKPSGPGKCKIPTGP